MGTLRYTAFCIAVCYICLEFCTALRQGCLMHAFQPVAAAKSWILEARSPPKTASHSADGAAAMRNGIRNDASCLNESWILEVRSPPKTASHSADGSAMRNGIRNDASCLNEYPQTTWHLPFKRLHSPQKRLGPSASRIESEGKTFLNWVSYLGRLFFYFLFSFFF